MNFFKNHFKKILNLPDTPMAFQSFASGSVPNQNMQDSSQTSPNDQSGGSSSNPQENADLQKTFDVVMKSHIPASKLKLVKYFKDRMSMTLVQAKNFVESLPQTVVSGTGVDDADQLVNTLTELGAEVAKVESKK